MFGYEAEPVKLAGRQLRRYTQSACFDEHTCDHHQQCQARDGERGVRARDTASQSNRNATERAKTRRRHAEQAEHAPARGFRRVNLYECLRHAAK